MTRLIAQGVLVSLLSAWLLVTAPGTVMAGGISVDSGLTPAQGRVVLRTQLRYMRRAAPQWDPEPSMEMYMVPLVAAWGALPKLTLMARAAVGHRVMTMMGREQSSTGLGDLLVLVKYGALRVNTRRFVIALAPTLGVEAPSGTGGISSKTWDLHAGIHVTARWRRLSMDLSTKYLWNGMDRVGAGMKDPGDEVGVDLSVSHPFPLPKNPSLAFAPVLEFSFRHQWRAGRDGQGQEGMAERFLYVSPGLMFITRWVIFEALAQLPVWQESSAGMDPRQFGLIGGIRVLL
jgi:hypothetical protein